SFVADTVDGSSRTVLSFGKDDGLLFLTDNLLDGTQGVYTIDTLVELDDLTSGTTWRKLVDYDEFGADAGFYFHNRSSTSSPSPAATWGRRSSRAPTIRSASRGMRRASAPCTSTV